MTHLIWLAAASKSAAARDVLLELAKHPDAGVRVQAVRGCGEFRELGAPATMFETALIDSDPAVQHAAIVALFGRNEPLPEALFVGPALSKDTYLRQASAFLLAERATQQQLNKLLAASDAESRLAGVLATGFRLTVPPEIGAIPTELPLRYESGNALFTIQYADESVDLKKLARVGSFTTAEHWNSLPPSDAERQLAAALVARLNDNDDRVCEQAAYFLSLLDDKQFNPLVAQSRRATLLRSLERAPETAIASVWQVGPFADGADGFATAHPIERGPIDVAAPVATGASPLQWRRAEGRQFALAAATTLSESSYVYFRLLSLEPQRAMLTVRSGGKFKAWHNGRPVADDEPLILALEPGSNDVLLRLAHGAAEGSTSVSVRAPARIEATLPERLADGSLAERLKSAGTHGADSVSAEFSSVDWALASAGGSAERGRKLFSADALGCAKCHAVTPHQKGGGAPSLAGAAQRFTVGHLVESILVPSKQVTPIFGTTSIVTDEGRTLAGLVVEEDNEHVVLLLANATRESIVKRAIENRKLQNVSPMPSGLVKTPAELGDLLAYLLSANPQAP